MFPSTPFFLLVGFLMLACPLAMLKKDTDISVEKSTMLKDLNGINHKRKNKDTKSY